MGRAIAIAVMMLASTVAHAQPAAEAAGEARVESYGAGMAVIDGISVALAAGGLAIAATGGDAAGLGVLPFIIGAGGYMFLTPVAHLGHDNMGAAYASFVMRTAAPVVGTIVGAHVVSCPPEEETSWCRRTKIGAAIGAGVGVLAWSVIDDGFLAKRKVPVVYVTPTNDGGALGVTGRF